MTIALPALIGESGADLIPRRRCRMPQPFESDYTFGNRVDKLFMDSQTARLSRALENSQRNVQKWVAGHEGVPPHAKKFVEQQLALVETIKPHPFIEMRAYAKELLEKGVHPEVVAGYMSKLYEDITGKTIR